MKVKAKLEVEAIRNGTVIDHIPADRTLLAVEVLTDKEDCVFIGINLTSSSQGKKGIIKIQDKVLNEKDLRVLSAIAHQATVNVIKEYEIVDKIKLEIPEVVEGLLLCSNQKCITNHESVTTHFKLINNEYHCLYCERSFPINRLEVQRPNI